jgi:hypothetical protein
VRAELDDAEGDSGDEAALPHSGSSKRARATPTVRSGFLEF